MHATLSSLTAGLVFIHAVFGCCWHHAHRCEEQAESALAVAAHCCPKHEDDAAEQPSPCDCRVECGGSCTYLPPEKVRIDAPQLALGLEVAVITPTAADAFMLPVSWSSSRAGPPNGAPPLRLHLVHQLMLN
jgi:hypothetical protein